VGAGGVCRNSTITALEIDGCRGPLGKGKKGERWGRAGDTLTSNNTEPRKSKVSMSGWMSPALPFYREVEQRRGQERKGVP